MIDESNPAGRLYRVLAAVSQRDQKLKVRDVWAKQFACDPKDDATVIRRLVELYDLCEEVRRLLGLRSDLNQDLYLSSVPVIQSALFPVNLGQEWQHVKIKLTGEVLTRLQFCAEALARDYSERAISEAELKELDQMVRNLVEAILESATVPADLKLALLEEAAKIEETIAIYRIKGARGLKEARQSLAGLVVTNLTELKTLKASDPSVLERLGQLLDKLDRCASRALKLKRLVETPIRFLLKQITDPDEAVDEVGDDTEPSEIV